MAKRKRRQFSCILLVVTLPLRGLDTAGHNGLLFYINPPDLLQTP